MYGLPDNAVVGFGKRAKGAMKPSKKRKSGLVNDETYELMGEWITSGLSTFFLSLRKFPIFQTKEYKEFLKKQEEQG
jgi:hypothetical protein